MASPPSAQPPASVRLEQSHAEHGGMALMLTHPDYLDDEALAHYDRFLALQAGDQAVWHALPREIARWWRQRTGAALTTSN